MLKREDEILFSGGALGAEEAFGACAESFGIEEVNFSFEGHKPTRTRGLRVLNHEELAAGEVSLAYVSRLMNRRYPDTPTFRKILQSIWYQVNNGQEIYVIGAIQPDQTVRDRKSTRLNSSHSQISYAVFCLKKKKKKRKK